MDVLEGLKPGDSCTVSREGKVFLTQYTHLGAFVSVTRVLGADPVADFEAMGREADRMWHAAMLRNHALVNGSYEAMGAGNDVEKLLEYLERKSRGDAEETPPSKPAIVKRKLGGK